MATLCEYDEAHNREQIIWLQEQLMQNRICRTNPVTASMDMLIKQKKSGANLGFNGISSTIRYFGKHVDFIGDFLANWTQIHVYVTYFF